MKTDTIYYEWDFKYFIDHHYDFLDRKVKLIKHFHEQLNTSFYEMLLEFAKHKDYNGNNPLLFFSFYIQKNIPVLIKFYQFEELEKYLSLL